MSEREGVREREREGEREREREREREHWQEGHGKLAHNHKAEDSRA